MRILLYNPDNGVTRNFMPHLWMFLLQEITPPGHEVLLVDGNAKPMNEEELVRFAVEQNVGLVGIGAMTRMIARAYRMADAVRAAGIPVVMGGPHITEVPDEPLGRDGGPRHAIDLDQFNIVPKFLRSRLSHVGIGWGTCRIIPIESGRGCPYGCEFCTVTGFFGDSIRFRSNQSIVSELLRLKARARSEEGQIIVFFVDDNFAINIKRTKSLLQDIIAADAQLPWIAQISANLLRDEELVDLIAASGGKLVFIGMESIDPANLADVNKSFNKPGEYAAVLERLAQRNLYAITSFIFGMDNDTPGVAERTLQQIRSWPPGLPVFGQLTPFPATPLYDRLLKAGRLTRPKHWLEFAPYQMAHTPLKMSIAQAQKELDHAWASSYSPERIAEALDSLSHRSVGWPGRPLQSIALAGANGTFNQPSASRMSRSCNCRSQTNFTFDPRNLGQASTHFGKRSMSS